MSNKEKQILQTSLVLLLTSYQMVHIAAVEGWYAACVIELSIVILSVLRKYKTLSVVILLSGGFVLSGHFETIGSVPIQSIVQILFCFTVPVIVVTLAKTETVPEVSETVAEETETPVMEVETTKESMSQELKRLNQSGRSLRQLEADYGISYSTIRRMIKSA